VKSGILSAARESKRRAIAAAKQADALIQVARQEAKTVARRRKLRQTLRGPSTEIGGKPHWLPGPPPWRRSSRAAPEETAAVGSSRVP
jgi:hypothetical protein